MNRRHASIFIALSLGLAQVARAAEEAHAPAGAGTPLWPLIFSTINLALFIWILARFAMPGVRAWVSERRGRIVHELQEAAAAKAAAERLRADWEARLAQLDHEIADMRARVRQDAERDRDRILAAARKAAEAIQRDAERSAAYEVRRTQEQVRAELVRQAVQLAADAARQQWTPADQQRFVTDFLKQVQS